MHMKMMYNIYYISPHEMHKYKSNVNIIPIRNLIV